MGMYFNLICEEMEITGGKVIHIDKNIGNMDERILKNIPMPNGNFIQ